MVFQAILKNSNHGEYGVATIPFPIPPEQYDHTLELLEALEIGDVTVRDCYVEEIKSNYDILHRLEGGRANLDELDYLAKRLDSFWEPEDAQFQGMAEKLGLSSITDLINLTFCCQQATIITDFSDWETIGKDHFLTVNGGAVSSEKLEQLDARQFALDLIHNHEGTVTPYGVVYDNGMELERLYRGRSFPQYAYSGDSPIRISVFRPEDPDELIWLELPMPDSQLERMLSRAGAGRSSSPRVENVCEDLPTNVTIVLNYDTESVWDLNHMAAAVAKLDKQGKWKLDAAVELTEAGSAAAIQRLAENLGLFDFYPGVTTPEEYGRHMIQESGHFQYDAELDEFYNFERYGNWRLQNELGGFVAGGYLAYHGVISIPELLDGVKSQRVEEPETFQMGGL